MTGLRRASDAAAVSLLVGLAFSPVTGCGSAEEPAGVDGAGSAPLYRGEMARRIGQVAGDDAYLFGRIGGVVPDAEGRVFVADHQASEVRVFDPGGRFLFRFGREGEGPGELVRPCCMAFGPDGGLWIRDAGNNRYSVFRVSGDTARFERPVAMQHQSAGLWAPVTFDRAGRPIDVGVRTSEEGEPRRVRLHLGAGGSVDSVVEIPSPPPERIGQHRVVRETEGGRARLYVNQPFGPRHLMAHGPDGRWARAVSSEYRVIVHPPDGRADTIVRPDATGPALSEAEREQARERLDELTDWAGVSSGDLPFGVPERKPPLRALAFDTAGRLWVERSVPDGSDRVADVYSTNLELEARHRWSSRVPLGPESWLGTRELIGVSRDTLGVERVVRIRFTPEN